MVAAYRHDAHELNGETHDYAPDTFHGVPVNQTVPHGADGDASALSRPRLSEAVSGLLTGSNPEAMHPWLTSDVASGFNERIDYPYTSLKYHTLLVAALLDNYRPGHEFTDLLLVVDDAGEIVPDHLCECPMLAVDRASRFELHRSAERVATRQSETDARFAIAGHGGTSACVATSMSADRSGFCLASRLPDWFHDYRE